MTLNDGAHAQLRPGRAGGSVTQRGAGQGWSKGCSEEFNTSRLTWALRHVYFFEVSSLSGKVFGFPSLENLCDTPTAQTPSAQNVNSTAADHNVDAEAGRSQNITLVSTSVGIYQRDNSN